MEKYNHVIGGGTFDHFHKGHASFLEFALSLGNRLTIGITSDIYISNFKQRDTIQSFNARKRAVESFIKKKHKNQPVSIIAIDDEFGPTLDPRFIVDAIVASENTLQNAQRINAERQRRTLSPLAVKVCPLIPAQDGLPITSSRIRSGEINRDGRLFIKPSWRKNVLTITDTLRNDLKNPAGKLLKNSGQLKDLSEEIVKIQKHYGSSRIVTVGDQVTRLCNELHVKQRISIIDFVVERKKIYTSIQDLGFTGEEKQVHIDNPAGQLHPSLFQKMAQVIHEQQRVIIQISGEEDLTALVAVLVAPLGYAVIYGQPHEGIVVIDIDEKVKEQAFVVVSGFTEVNTRGH